MRWLGLIWQRACVFCECVCSLAWWKSYKCDSFKLTGEFAYSSISFLLGTEVIWLTGGAGTVQFVFLRLDSSALMAASVAPASQTLLSRLINGIEKHTVRKAHGRHFVLPFMRNEGTSVPLWDSVGAVLRNSESKVQEHDRLRIHLLPHWIQVWLQKVNFQHGGYCKRVDILPVYHLCHIISGLKYLNLIFSLKLLYSFVSALTFKSWRKQICLQHI